jgi:cysteinyl-tRNA synthetase
MASELLGDNMDVHAGGVDLKFPHHDNELCQSEAYHGCGQWVNHFWHFGHLEIKGLKMSKSLKNFITIRQALVDFSARQIRLLFLLQPWDKRIDFSDQTVGEVKTKESTLINFFGQIKEVMRQPWLSKRTSWGAPERALQESLARRQASVHEHLCDSFNTVSAMGELLGICSDSFAYLKEHKEAPDALLLKRAAVYVTKMLRIFGVITQDDFGFPVAGGGDSYEQQVGPMLDALVSFRDEVRAQAKAAKPPLTSLLDACDSLRDSTLVDLGVRVEDRAEGALWKLDDPATLRKEVLAKVAAASEQAATKLHNKLSVKVADLAKAQAAAVPPTELLRQPQFAAKFSGFGDDGKPTADAKGEPLSKAAQKEADKLLAKQAKEHTKHAEALKKNPGLLEELAAAVEELRGQARAVLEKEGEMLSADLCAKLRKELGVGGAAA